jgi:hypothetical protein
MQEQCKMISHALETRGGFLLVVMAPIAPRRGLEVMAGSFT